jgi:VanZ family protein
LVVVIGSLLPAQSAPIKALDLLGISDKLEHFLAYSFLAFLPAVHERWNFVVAAALGAIALGVGLEYGQLYSPGRSFEIADMAADAMGVCFGLIVGIPLRSSVALRSFLYLR